MDGGAARRGGSGGGAVGQPAEFAASAGAMSPPAMQPPAVTPSGKALMEGYRKDILNGFEKERPAYNPV